MKTRITFLLMIFFGVGELGATLHADPNTDQPPLRKGDAAARILDVLGPPDGLMETGSRGIYYYDRGEVHTRDGEVTFIHLISEEALKERQREEALARAERIREGEALRAEWERTGRMDGLSGREQLRIWERFRTTYPEVDVSIPLAAARDLARIEIEREQEEARIARLERRVLEAELRAERAREQAANAQLQASRSANRLRYSSGCWGIPRVYGYVSHRGDRRSSSQATNRTSLQLTRQVRGSTLSGGLIQQIQIRPSHYRDTTLAVRYID